MIVLKRTFAAYWKLGLIMRSSVAFRLFVALSPLLGIADGSLAQERASVSVHRTCIGGGTGEKVFLRYWWPDVNDSIPEPVCVFKTPEFGGLPLPSARTTPDRTGICSIVVIEFCENAPRLASTLGDQTHVSVSSSQACGR